MSIKKIFYKLIAILSVFFKKKYIVMESVPDVADNTYYAFLRLYAKKPNYKYIWIVKNTENFKDEKNVKYINETSLKKHFYIYNAKALLSCNKKMASVRKNQFSIYLQHGSTIKALRPHAVSGLNITNYLCDFEDMREILVEDSLTEREKIVCLGFPRNDAFFEEKVDLHNYFNKDFEKIIVWYPTFRQNHGKISASDSDDALPIINTVENAMLLNECAKKYNVLIAIKPHFAQDLSYLNDFDLSNIVFFGDDLFIKNKITSYKFVASTDALITDYSSIYFDYLNLKKPIALTWQDYEEYKKRPGFAIDTNRYMAGGEKVYSIEELIKFIENIGKGNDVLGDKRNKLVTSLGMYNDGRNSDRVTDFIIEKANL